MLSAWLVAAAMAGCASSNSVSAWRVPVVSDANLVRGCQLLGTVSDNEIDDLQKKVLRLGGNVALLTPGRWSKGGYFGAQDYMTADAYQCEGTK
jgi:hypothetical protein